MELAFVILAIGVAWSMNTSDNTSDLIIKEVAKNQKKIKELEDRIAKVEVQS
jgi:hypothetical protein